MSSFKDEELLLLSNLMYVKKEYYFKKNIWTEGNKGKTLNQILERTLVGNTKNMTQEEIDIRWDVALSNLQEQNIAEVYGGEIEPAEWADMLQSIRNSEIGDLILQEVEKDDTGAISVCLVDGENNAYVVFRGTAGGEWRDNFEGGYSSDTEQQRKALEFVNSLGDYNSITTIGHSKGGNKAKYVAILCDEVTRCVSFDGQGFSKEFIDKYSSLIEKNEGKITNYALDYDFVNLLMYDVGEKIYIEKNDGINNIVQFHSSSSFFHYDESGEYKLFADIQVNETLVTQVLHGLVCYVLNTAEDEDKEALLDFLGGLLANTLGDENKDKSFDLIDYFLAEKNVEEVGLLMAYLVKYFNYDEYALDVFCEWIAQFGHEGEMIADALPELVEIINNGLDGFNESYLKDAVKKMCSFLGSEWDITFFEIIDIACDKYENLPSVVRNIGEYEVSSIKRDFSEEMKLQLLELCREVENEPWYDVSKWDIWYYGEKWLNRVSIKNYTNNINEYYREAIDMNDENESAIKQIFEDVYKIDRDYAHKLELKNQEIARLIKSIKKLEVSMK